MNSEDELKGQVGLSNACLISLNWIVSSFAFRKRPIIVAAVNFLSKVCIDGLVASESGLTSRRARNHSFGIKRVSLKPSLTNGDFNDCFVDCFSLDFHLLKKKKLINDSNEMSLPYQNNFQGIITPSFQ